MKQWSVGDVMSADVVTVREETPYREIVDVMAARQISAVPVVDERHHVVGVVSEADLLHKIEFAVVGEDRRVFEGRRRRSARAKADAGTAADLMTAPAITVVEGTSIVTAAKIMEREQVKRLPVTDAFGRLVGIVARGDLLRVYLRPDAQVRRDVVDQVLRRVLFLEPGTVRVEVHDGSVTLSGLVDRRTSARIAVQLTRAVPGVTEVKDLLSWEFDDTVLADAGRFTPSPFGAP